MGKRCLVRRCYLIGCFNLEVIVVVLNEIINVDDFLCIGNMVVKRSCLMIYIIFFIFFRLLEKMLNLVIVKRGEMWWCVKVVWFRFCCFRKVVL